jgi:hypothetical protein
MLFERTGLLMRTRVGVGVRSRLTLGVLLGVASLTAALVLGACGSSISGSGGSSGTQGMSGSGSAPTSTSMPMSMSPSTTTMAGSMSGGSMSGMSDMPTGNGLAASASGFHFMVAGATLPAGTPNQFQFQIMDAAGKALTRARFEPDQTKLLHFYLIRSDLTGFQHVHPTIAADSTWTADLGAVRPGTYRAYVAFIVKDAAGKATPLVLSQRLTVPGAGAAAARALPPASPLAWVDGYTLRAAGFPMAGRQDTLKLSVFRGGKPVTNLQPYLGTYAHLTAFHRGDLAFAHLHPQGMVHGDHGGPTLTFDAMLPKAGDYRLFVQFQTAGMVHTTALTLHVGSAMSG